MINYRYNAKVLRVVDGDTVDLMVDLGFNSFAKERFRLHGINAPETRTLDKEEKKKGLESKKWLTETLEKAGNEVEVKTLKASKGKYGRYLAYIYVDGININTEMVNLGLATLYLI